MNDSFPPYISNKFVRHQAACIYAFTVYFSPLKIAQKTFV